jgi:integrase
MKRTLTDRLLHSLTKPHVGAREIWDQQLRGFGCRASPNGVVSFFAMRCPRGSTKPVRFKLGNFPVMSLSAARQRARSVLVEMQDGIDPRARKAEEARTAAAAKANSFATVAEAFIARHVAGKRTARDIEARIRRELIPRWGEWPITSITRVDVIALVDDIIDRGHREAARQTLTYARRLFGWAVPRYDLQHAPTDHLKAKDLIGAKRPRSRVLDDRELALIWRACEGPAAAYYGPFIRLLLLTGVRRSELGGAIWLEVDELASGRWAIPAARRKTDEAYTVFLAPAAVAILRTLLDRRPLPRGTDLVLGARIHYVRAKTYLDCRIAALNGGEPLAPWRLHDLRRSFRTNLSRLGIAPHVAELCIGHRQPGLHRVYDQYRYADEQRHAFEAWAAHVLRLVEPPAKVVIPLRSVS